MAQKTISIKQLWQEYAEALGVDELTETEKKQAFLDAVLEGRHVEPFVSLTPFSIGLFHRLANIGTFMMERYVAGFKKFGKDSHVKQ